MMRDDDDDLETDNTREPYTIPMAKEGAPVPLIWGKVRVRAPSVIFYKNWPAYWTGDVGSGGESWFDIVPGTVLSAIFHHYTTIHFALGLPMMIGKQVDPLGATLHTIWWGDEVLWSGEVIDTPLKLEYEDYKEFLGGEGKGGGVAGQINWHQGTFQQVQDPHLDFVFTNDADLDETLLPAYRGLINCVFGPLQDSNGEPTTEVKGFYIGESDRVDPISFEVKSLTDPLLQDGGGAGGEGDANPIEVIYDILVNPWGRLGLPVANIDLTTFNAAATAMHTEMHGFSIIQHTGVDAGAMIAEVLKEIDAVLYVDITTQKICIKLIREDYVLGTLDVYDESNIIKVDEYSQTLWSETFNEVALDYTLRADDYTTRTVYAQDMANIAMQGGRRRLIHLAYPGINTQLLANKIVARELKAVSLPFAKARLLVNRDALELVPGDVFKFSWAEYGISEMVFRVLSFGAGTLDDNAVSINCVEDRFASDATVFDVADVPSHVINPYPDPVEDQDVFEVPRWLNIRAAQLDAVSNDEASRLFFCADKPAHAGLFDGEISFDGGDNFAADKTSMRFVDYAEVETLYSKLDEPYDETTGLRINTLSPGLVLETATEAEIQEEGKNLILVDDEFMAFEGFTDEGGGVFTLEDVWRGLLDTVPAQHAVDASIYFVLSRSMRPLGWRVYGGDELLPTKLITRNSTRALKASSAPVEEVQLTARATLPVRPQRFRMTQDLQATPTNNPGTITENMVLASWNRRERDRVIINRGDDLDDAETGTVYDVDCKVERDSSWTELDPDVDATGSYAEFQTMGHGPAELRVVAEDAAALEPFQDPTIDFILARYRQLLLNPSFDGDNRTGALDHWTQDVGSPPVTSSNPLDAVGYSVGGTGVPSWTLSQVVKIDKFNPEGLYTRLRFYAYGSDAADSFVVTLAAQEADGTPIGSVTTGSIVPTTTWTSHDLAYTLPPLTGRLKVTVAATDAGPGDNKQQFDEFDLRIGDNTSQLLLNPQFNVNTASWVAASGVWGVATPSFEGANAVRCTSTAGSYELYQEVLLPTGFKDTGMAWFRGWESFRAAAPTVEFVLEARNIGGVLASATTGAITHAADSKWYDHDLFLDLPDATDRLRLRVRYVQTGSGNIHMDDFRLFMFKNLHPDVYDETSDFSTPTVQTFPDTRLAWSEFSAYLPWAVWQFEEATGTDFADSLDHNSDSLWHLFKVNTPDLAQVLAGFYDGTDLSSKLCFETEDGIRQGAEFHALNQLSIDGENSFTVIVAFRAHDVAGWRSLMGSMGEIPVTLAKQGWSVDINSTGQVRATIISDTPIIANLTLTEDHSGAVPHYVAFQYNATTGEFRVWSDLQSIAATAIPAGDVTNLAKAIIGSDPTGTSMDAQFGYGALWIDDDGEDVSPTETGAWWNHAQDPSEHLDGYDPKDIIAGDVDSDSDGVIVGRFSPDQIVLVRDTGLTAGRGLSMHKAQTNLVDPDPNSAAWIEEGPPTINKREGPDAERFHRSVLVTSDNSDAYRPPAITLGANDVTVVWYAKGHSSHNARLVLWDDVRAVSIIHDYAVTTSWVRYSHTFAWAGSTATFELWFHGSDDGTPRKLYLSTPIGVFNLDYAPDVIHPRTGALAAVSGALNNVLPIGFNEEGEISVTGICSEVDPGSVDLLDIHNGTNNNDRRWLGNTGVNTAQFSHFDAGGAIQSDAIASAWTSEWIFRGRWNFGRLLEDPASFSGCHYNASDNYGRVATFSTTAVVLDEIDLGAFGAIVSRIRLTSRELPR